MNVELTVPFTAPVTGNAGDIAAPAGRAIEVKLTVEPASLSRAATVKLILVPGRTVIVLFGAIGVGATKKGGAETPTISIIKSTGVLVSPSTIIA